MATTDGAENRTIRMECACGAKLWFRNFAYWSEVHPVLLAWIESHKHSMSDLERLARRQALGLSSGGAASE